MTSRLASTDAASRQLLEDCQNRDKQDEDWWRGDCSEFLRKFNLTEDASVNRKHLSAEFRSGSDKLRAELHKITSGDLPEMVSNLRNSSKTIVSDEFRAEALNESWAFYRMLFARAWYGLKDLIDNPPSFNHKRLNSRMDLRYISLLHPGLRLWSGDKDMQALARCLHGEGILFQPQGTR